MRTLLFILLVSLSAAQLSAQTYKVIKVKGTVKVNNKVLRQNARVTIKKTDRVVFQPSTAKAAIYSNSEGLVILKGPKQAPGTVKRMLEGRIADYFKLSKKVTGTRAGELCTPLDFQNYFGENEHVVLGDEIAFKICGQNFPLDESTFFILSYDYEGEADPIYKKLSSRGDSLILSGQEIYSIDGQPVEKEKVSNMVLAYYNDKEETEQVICTLYPIFADEQELKDELGLLVEIGKENGDDREKIISTITVYLNENYGKVNKDDLNDWLLRNLSL